MVKKMSVEERRAARIRSVAKYRSKESTKLHEKAYQKAYDARPSVIKANRLKWAKRYKSYNPETKKVETFAGVHRLSPLEFMKRKLGGVV